MEEEFDINVREIQLKDIDLIADYWLKSDSDFLVEMGVDLNKLPTRKGLVEMLTEQINNSISDKKSYALIWELNGKEIGHSNVNGIEKGKEATMHLHLWKSVNRKRGIGFELVKKSIPFYFEKLKIKKLICEPYALNPAANRTLEKIGFEFIKRYKTIPGSLNFEQEVNRWELTKENHEKNKALQQLSIRPADWPGLNALLTNPVFIMGNGWLFCFLVFVFLYLHYAGKFYSWLF